MKKLLLITVILLAASHVADAQTKKRGYVSLAGSYSGIPDSFKEYYVDGKVVGIGAGIHGMIGKKISVGLDFAYASMDLTQGCRSGWTCEPYEQHHDAVGGGVIFTFLGRITNWLYYVPQGGFTITALLEKDSYHTGFPLLSELPF